MSSSRVPAGSRHWARPSLSRLKIQPCGTGTAKPVPSVPIVQPGGRVAVAAVDGVAPGVVAAVDGAVAGGGELEGTGDPGTAGGPAAGPPRPVPPRVRTRISAIASTARTAAIVRTRPGRRI